MGNVFYENSTGKSKKCIIVKCKRCLGTSPYVFSIGNIYYFSAKAEGISNIIARDDYAIPRLTHIQLNYLKDNPRKINALGYEFEVLCIKDVPNDFNFMTGEYHIYNVASKEDREFLEKHYESYNKGYDVSGTQQQVDDIYNKYAEVRKIQY